MSGVLPEPEPGDGWRWAVVGVIGFAVLGVLRMRTVRPFVFLAEGCVGVVLLIAVVAGLIRLLR